MSPIATMVAELGSDLGLDVHIGNEANLAAIAEASFRPGSTTSCCSPAPSALVQGSWLTARLLRGSSGFGGEVGHMPVELQGGLCACGRRGCWETQRRTRRPPQGASRDRRPDPGARIRHRAVA